MAQQSKTAPKPIAQAKPVVEDLSSAISQALAKAPDEVIRSVRVYDNCYRCNWWVAEEAESAMFAVSTAKIRKSRFVRATMKGDELVIEDVVAK